MPNNTTTLTLASTLRQHKPTSASVGYPPWLRAKVGSYVRERREAGARVTKLSDELGVSTTTLIRWARITQSHQGGGFAEVVATTPASRAGLARAASPVTAESRPSPSSRVGPVHITSPQGFSLHGLSFEQAVAVLSRLR